MKSNAIIRIVVLSLAILVLLGILLGVLALDTYHFSFKSRINRDQRIEEVTSQIDLEYVLPHDLCHGRSSSLAPSSDRIPVELFQILKDDAVESAALNMQYAGSRQ